MTAATPVDDRRRWIALVVVCLAMLMNVLDTSIVNVALPAIQRDLGFSQASLTWVVDAYLISFGSFLLMAGRLGDLVGRRKVFLVGVTLFTIASAACALAESQAVLIAARFVQGLGGAVSSSVIIALIVIEFPKPDERAKAMSAYIFVAVGGGALGLLAGGVLTQVINWHWIFAINLPIGIATIVLGRALLERDEGVGLGEGVDIIGSVLVTVALMLGIFGIVKVPEYGWADLHTLAFGGAALALLAMFLFYESRITNPIMPLRILRLRGLVGSSAVRGCGAAGMYAVFFLGALYLEHVRRYTPIQTGLAFLPLTVVVAAMSSGITARLVARFGPRRVVAPGLVCMIAALLLLSRIGEDASYFPDLVVPFVLLGVGGGASFLPLLTIAMADVPTADAGLGSGIVNVSMQISAAIGLAVFGTLATNHTNSLIDQGAPTAAALTDGYTLAFLVAAGCVAVGLLASPHLLRPARRTVAEPEPQRQAA
jgi:EmrB/QacA subfamily drug resistance transporter